MTAEQGSVAAVSCNDTYAFTKPARTEIRLVAGVGVAGDVHAGAYVKHRGRVRNDPTQPNLRQVHLIHQELFAEVSAKGYAVEPGDLGENVTTSGIDLLGLPRGTILRFGASPAKTLGGEAGVSVPSEPAAGGSVAAGPVAADLVAADLVAGGSMAVGPVAAGLVTAGALGMDDGSVRDAGSLSALLAVAAAARLSAEAAGSAAAVAAAVARDPGDDPRPAVIVAGLRNPCAQINGFRAGLLKEVLDRDENGRLVRKAGIMGVVLRGGAIRPGDSVTAELPPLPHSPLDPV